MARIIASPKVAPDITITPATFDLALLAGTQTRLVATDRSGENLFGEALHHVVALTPPGAADLRLWLDVTDAVTDARGRLQEGRVEAAFLFEQTETGRVRLLKLTGLDLDAADLTAALRSAGRADDGQLLATMLAGSVSTQ